MKNDITDYLYDRWVNLKGRVEKLEHRLDNLEKGIKEKNILDKTFGDLTGTFADLTNNFKVCTCADISNCVCGNGLKFILKD